MQQRTISRPASSAIAKWVPISHFSVSAFALVLLLAPLEQVSGGNGGGGGIMTGQRSRRIVCPAGSEINPCTCRVMSKGLDIVCDNADAKHIMNALDVLKKNSFTIYWMKFRSCILPRVKDYIFLGLDVRRLIIIRSNVSVIERSSLSSLGLTMTELDLSNNNIHEVPTLAFRSLKTLKFLNLKYNKITALHANAFEGLVMLERLWLYENQIKHIHDNAFKGIGRRLIKLDLGNNKLTDIPTDTFHPLKNLSFLYLNENKIEHLPNGAFEDLTMLKSLNLEHNKITNISEKAFGGLENLTWLNLGHNILDHIPSYALPPLHILLQLNLDSNRIHEVVEDAFRGYGDTIRHLKLRMNHIKSIHPLTFIDLHSLKWLYLSDNELTTLSQDTIQPIIDTLTRIDISDNPLVCNCDIYWLYQWLIDPNNYFNEESTGIHRCTTADGETHVIKLLTDQHFNCKRRPRIIEEHKGSASDGVPGAYRHLATATCAGAVVGAFQLLQLWLSLSLL